MLKIKDDVTIEALEKYGFEEVEDAKFEYNNEEESGAIVIQKDNEIFAIVDNKAGDILYDLIQAGLVEKC